MNKTSPAGEFCYSPFMNHTHCKGDDQAEGLVSQRIAMLLHCNAVRLKDKITHQLLLRSRIHMRIIPTALIAFFCLAAAVQAQNSLPAPAKTDGAPAPLTAVVPPPSTHSRGMFRPNIFWPLVAACGSAAVVDGKMSRTYLDTHPMSEEIDSAWLVGRRPSLGRYYATFVVLDGGGALISYKLLHSRRKAFRVVGWSILGGLTYIHVYDDIALAAR